jgi:4-diphosphocytidyl-2-C-methyl-D-erythritol kinase
LALTSDPPSLPLLVRAPAKVNLCLFVGPRRADGLHEIRSLFQSVTLADELLIEAGGGRDEVECSAVGEPNLALVALERFRAEIGLDEPGLKLAIEKRIPLAAGLGGGSADAAAVLRACAALRGMPVSGLAPLAMSLGADVPSQLEPGMQLVSGAGEQVEPLHGPSGLALVVLAGDTGLATRDVYERADALGLPDHDLDAAGARTRSNVEQASEAASLAALVHNDLERAALDLAPETADLLALARAEGALAAAVSGSGPSVFGLFASRAAAESAARAIAGRFRGRVELCDAVPPGYGEPFPAAAVSARPSAERSGSGQTTPSEKPDGAT